VHDAVGDDAEIIFGAVHEPAMMGEIRVTVIATGFDRDLQGGIGRGSSQSYGHAAPAPSHGGVHPPRTGTTGSFANPRAVSQPAIPTESQVLPFPTQKPQVPRPTGPSGRPWEGVPPRSRSVPPPSAPPPSSSELDDMEIPTFIRRQMD
jgi:cell division protein FtsZ